MFNKNKRVLWLLNHRTLMPYEAPLIRRLGFEIYIPKVIPKTNFRSAALDFSYDSSLSLPKSALDQLNNFNFYEDTWTPEIVTIVNRYFGSVFIIPHAQQVIEALKNFEGEVVFRAFGLDNGQSYRIVLESMYGPFALRMIKGMKERFWFGEGYDNLHECEDPVFKERSLYLPIGVPDSFYSNSEQWKGVEKKILFVCPHVVSNPYYAAIYAKFKRDFGDLPHVIVGAQDGPVSDPHVAGFVSDDELQRLYLECAVLYYPSTEMRHVHYSPIEASINGMPVVFFKDSLLDRLSRNSTKGRVSTIAEARALIERILAGDEKLISEIKTDQREIAYHFSDAYCGAMWRERMAEGGFLAALKPEPQLTVLQREIKRTLMLPFARGRIVVNPHKKATEPFKAELNAERAAQHFGSSLYDGIKFSATQFPEMVDYVSGVGATEEWGRWSTGHEIVIALKHLLEGEFRLYIHGVGYEKNAGISIPVKIGSQTRSLCLSSELGKATTGTWLHFNLKKPSSVIKITVPFPVRPVNDSRLIGIGLIELRASPLVSQSAIAAKEKLGSSLSDGIDFTQEEFPPFVDSINGISLNEPWGRWSNGDRVVVELKHTLKGRFRFILRAIAYGRNVGVPVRVRIGVQTRTLKLPASLRPDEEFAVEFVVKTPSNVIEITVPHPTRPPNDGRALGIGFYSMRSESVSKC